MIKIFSYSPDDLPFRANTYVIGKVGAKCLLVDLSSETGEVYDYVKSHYDAVEGILLTHAHYDHIRGLTAFLKHYKKPIPVFLHPADRPLLNDPSQNGSRLQGDSVSVPVSTVDIEDGETLPFKDFNVQVLHTPFHTEGSVCYYMPDENALFTGDSLFAGGIGRTDLPTGNEEEVENSLRKLRNLRDTLVVFPGHGPIAHLGDEKKDNPYFRAALQ